MFDGVPPRENDDPPRSTTAALAGWSWTLVALLLALTIAAILAGLLFPNAFAYPGDHF
jgi:type II secretory pathway pseudopilin PulG